MMKQRRRGLACLSLAFVLLLAACGGRESVASRSAAAFDEAKRKGTPVEGGHEHGGHAAGDAHAADSQMSEMDHSAAQDDTGMDHSTTRDGTMTAMDHATHGSTVTGMDHSTHGRTTTGMDHSTHGGTMTGMDHSTHGGTMTGMDHSTHGGTMTGMDHSTHGGTMTGMDHSKMQSRMPGMDHSKMQSAAMPAMDHSATHDGTMPGMQHGTSTPAAHSSTTDLARIDPKATLSPDSFDAPSRVSVAEAVKAANNVPDGEIRHIVPGQDRENPPTPQPAFRGQAPSATVHPATDHGAHGASAPAAPTEAAISACPMHPEVTSDRPGSCPKCGMTLVKKEK